MTWICRSSMIPIFFLLQKHLYACLLFTSLWCDFCVSDDFPITRLYVTLSYYEKLGYSLFSSCTRRCAGLLTWRVKKRKATYFFCAKENAYFLSIISLISWSWVIKWVILFSLDDLLRAGINVAENVVVVNKELNNSAEEDTLSDCNTIVAVQTMFK